MYFKMNRDYVVAMMNDGGGTLAVLRDGDFLDVSTAIDNGYGVSLKGGKVIDLDGMTAESISDMIVDFAKNMTTGFLGLWVDGGKLYLDSTTIYYDFKKAMNVARDNEQLAVYDFAKRKAVAL
jgi:hypothetical protein